MTNHLQKKPTYCKISPAEQQKEAITSGAYLIEMNARLEKLRQLMKEQKEVREATLHGPPLPNAIKTTSAF